MIAAGFNLHRFTRGLVFNRLNDIRLDRTTPGMTGIAAAGTAGEIGRVAGQSAENLTAASSQSVWIQGIGGRTNTSADRQAAGYDENLWGVIGGYDRSVTPNLHLGGAIGYGHNRVDAGTFGTGNTETVQLMAYGLWRQNKLFANLALGYGWDHYDTSRTVDLHSGASSLTSSARGQSGFLDAEGGLRLNWNRWMVEPTLGVRGDILTRNGFNEQGGLGGLSVASDTYTAIQTRLGTKLSYGFDLGQERWLTAGLLVARLR
jgi:subtilase-type serine protease